MAFIFLFAPHLLTPVLQVIIRALSTLVIKQAGLTHAQALGIVKGSPSIKQAPECPHTF